VEIWFGLDELVVEPSLRRRGQEEVKGIGVNILMVTLVSVKESHVQMLTLRIVTDCFDVG